MEWAALAEDRRPNAWPVMDGESLDVEDDSADV
jgi:hypothetical protein